VQWFLFNMFQSQKKTQKLMRSPRRRFKNVLNLKRTSVLLEPYQKDRKTIQSATESNISSISASVNQQRTALESTDESSSVSWALSLVFFGYIRRVDRTSRLPFISSIKVAKSILQTKSVRVAAILVKHPTARWSLPTQTSWVVSCACFRKPSAIIDRRQKSLFLAQSRDEG